MKSTYKAHGRQAYVEKLKDPRWQRKRLEVLERADWTCVACGAKDKTLHVHHRQYLKDREPWDYSAEQLEVLCEDCHCDTHEGDDALLVAASRISACGETPRTRYEMASVLAGCVHHKDVPHDVDPDFFVLGEFIRDLPLGLLNIHGLIALQRLCVEDPERLAQIINGLAGMEEWKPNRSKSFAYPHESVIKQDEAHA